MHYQGKDLLPAVHTLVPPGQERASWSTEPAVLSRSIAVVVRLVRAVSIRSRWAARNPRWLTKSINSHATKREERFLFSRGGTVLVSLTLPATEVILRGNFASHLPLLASTALPPLPLMGKEILQRNQHNFYWGKAFRSNKSQKNQNSSLLLLYGFIDEGLYFCDSVYLYARVTVSFRKGFKDASGKARW